MNRIFLFGTCAAILLMTGCQDTVNTVENTEKAMAPETIRDTRIVTDGFLRDRLDVKDVKVSRTPDGFMKVQMEGRNVRTGFFSELWSSITGDSPYRLMYKFEWFDQNGMQVKGILSNWQRVDVIPGETFYFQGIAPNTSCRDFKISIREAE